MRRIVKPNVRLSCPHCKCITFTIFPRGNMKGDFKWEFRCCNCHTFAEVEKKVTRILDTSWLMKKEK